MFRCYVVGMTVWACVVRFSVLFRISSFPFRLHLQLRGAEVYVFLKNWARASWKARVLTREHCGLVLTGHISRLHFIRILYTPWGG